MFSCDLLSSMILSAMVRLLSSMIDNMMIKGKNHRKITTQLTLICIFIWFVEFHDSVVRLFNFMIDSIVIKGV